jgi:hypothetical protein
VIHTRPPAIARIFLTPKPKLKYPCNPKLRPSFSRQENRQQWEICLIYKEEFLKKIKDSLTQEKGIL